MSLMKSKVSSRLDLLDRLRTAYPLLATVASEWNSRMRFDERYPDVHPSFLKRCHDADQGRPMPLLLQHVPGDFNNHWRAKRRPLGRVCLRQLALKNPVIVLSSWLFGPTGV